MSVSRSSGGSAPARSTSADVRSTVLFTAYPVRACRLHRVRQVVFADNDHLLRWRQQAFERQPIRTGVEAEVLDDARERFQRVLRHLAQLRIPIQRLQAKQRGGCSRIPCRRRRVLQRLAASRERADCIRIVLPCRKIRRRWHRKSRAPSAPPASRRASIVAQFQRPLPRVETGVHQQRVVVEHAGDTWRRRLACLVGNNMRQPILL